MVSIFSNRGIADSRFAPNRMPRLLRNFLLAYLAILLLSSGGLMVLLRRNMAGLDGLNDEIMRSIWFYLCIYGLVLILASAVIMVLFSRYLMRPLSLFSQAARKIGVGQYDALPAFLSRNDEWGSLADAFGQMQRELTTREHRITETRDRLEAVLSSMIEGVVAIDPDRRIQISNRAACRMFSLTEPEIIGRVFHDVIRNPELTAAVNNTSETQQFNTVEFETLGDQPRKTIRARVSVLPTESQQAQQDADKPGIVAVLHDVTELRQLENMRRDFVANVSHELKTPLTSIKACAETLKLGAIHDEQKNMHFVQEIESNAEMLDRQIQDLLQLARVESGKENWEIKPISVNELCELCVTQFESEAIQRHVDLVFVPHPDSPVARADRDGVSTILKNLISNAIHYTPRGGRVEIAADLDNDQIVLRVTDTGIGISPEHQARIFERFYRVDKARSRDAGGTGLGLAIVKHLTQAFGGRVEVQSQLGQGSSFAVRLPVSSPAVSLAFH